ncbi:MFS transporter [Halobacteria archaeon AArc-m2/3/4]|uniref:MFS transporter n=1 Tax=Natronoglomus mannanivorans TaxID=2979990 RepID=A0ABT2QKM5_9EURY|nr:MFS transporter [Halobacteria archaeon AArc-m2/3/4]
MDERIDASDGGERLFRGYSGRLLVSLSLAYLVIQFGRNILSPLLPAIVEDLGITPFQAGIALSVLSATYALCMYPGGHFSDQLTRKTVLVAASVVSTVGFVSLLLANSYPPFVLGAATVGIGAGLYWISLRGLLADLFVARRGQAFGVQDSLGFAGPLLAAGGAVVVLEMTSWQMAFLPAAVLLAGSTIVAHNWIREPYDVSPVEFDFVDAGSRVFGDPQVRRLVIAYSCGIFAMQAVIGFLPFFLQHEHGFSSTLSSVGFAVLFLGAMVTLPISGYLGDRFSHVPVAVGGLLLGIVGLLLLLFAPTQAAIGVGILLFGFGIWAFPPVIQAYLMTRFPNESMGGDFGVFKTVYAGVGSVGPTYVGFVAGVADYATAFLGLVAFLVAAIAILLRL